MRRRLRSSEGACLNGHTFRNETSRLPRLGGADHYRSYDRLSARKVADFDTIVSSDPAKLVIGTAPGEWVTERRRLRFGFETEGVSIDPAPNPQGYESGSRCRETLDRVDPWNSHAESISLGEIARTIRSLSDGMLSARLAELGDAGLVEEKVLEGPPTGTLYRLTEQGRGMRGFWV